jgi:hypothetical protein
LIDQHHFGAQSAHHAGSFHGVAPGHNGYERVPFNPANDGQTGAGVAAGQLHYGLSRR